MQSRQLTGTIAITVFIVLILMASYSYPQDKELEMAKDLQYQASQLVKKGFYIDAVPIQEKCLALKEKALGPDGIELTGILIELAHTYSLLGNREKAVLLHERALSIGEKALGPVHPDVDKFRLSLMRHYQGIRALDKIERLYNYSLAEKEKAFGSDSIQLTDDMINLATNYRLSGNTDKAEALYTRALEIRKQALGSDHPDVADVFIELATLYMMTRSTDKAETLYRGALQIKENALGLDHPDVANAMDSLAMLLLMKGNAMDQVESLRKRALAIREKALGSDHPDLWLSLMFLAQYYQLNRDFDKAEAVYKRALSLQEKGLDCSSTASLLQMLAGLYQSQGKFDDAVPLYKKSVAMYKQTYGPDSQMLIQPLSSLRALYRSLGMNKEADKCQQRYQSLIARTEKQRRNIVSRSKKIAERSSSKEEIKKDEEQKRELHELYASIEKQCSENRYAEAMQTTERYIAFRNKIQFYGPDESPLKKALIAQDLTTLANIFHEKGGKDQAEKLYRQAIEYFDEAPSGIKVFVSFPLTGLSELLYSNGSFKKAQEPYKRLTAIYEKGSDPGGLLLTNCLNKLGYIYCFLDKYSQAHSCFQRAGTLANEIVFKVMSFAPERLKLVYMATLNNQIGAFLSLVSLHLADKRKAVQDILNLYLLRKGVILEIQKRFQEALIYSDDSRAIEAFQQLSRARSQLSILTFSREQGSRQNIKDLEKKIEDLEANLSQASKSFALKQKIARASYKAVAKALPENTAMLEFVKIKMLNFKAKGKESMWNPHHYLVFVLHAKNENNIGLVDLGESEKIDVAIANFKREIKNRHDLTGTGAVKAARKIYDWVFAPLKEEIGGVKEIFISPDGNLNLIPFEVLQNPDGRFLIEDYTFNYLAAGRDIIGFEQVVGKAGKALLMGDPDFDISADEKTTTLRNLSLKEIEEEDPAKRSSDLKGFNFKRLPGTKDEVESIHSLIGKNESEIYTGKSALEEVLMQKGTPSILHLATHGFFLSDIELDEFADLEVGMRGVGGVIKLQMVPGETSKIAKLKNPLLRSGIVLAGANNALKSENSEKGDGIVTAEKILGLRLRGTDMVVLSACDTGLGEVQTGEGVFGLRRAFTQAGARGLVMSMWPVPDQETRELMVAFYKNIVSNKMSRSQALRQAALKEMKIVKQRYGHRNPLFWGGFVFMGEP